MNFLIRPSRPSSAGALLGVSLLFLIVPEVKAEVWTTYTNATTVGGLVNNNVHVIVIDGNNKWFGTNTGVSKFDGEVWKSYTTGDGLAKSNVRAIAISGNGSKWFGFGSSGGGVSMLDVTEQVWETYTTADGLVSNVVYAIAIDGNDKWFGTSGGACKYGESGWSTYTATNSGLVYNSVTAIAIDGSGNKWFGTGQGVSVLDAAEQSWNSYTTANSGIVNNYIQAMAIDGNDKWFGAYNAGVSSFDGENWTTYTKPPAGGGLVDNNILAIAIDGSGNKWFGTSGGVSKFNGNEWITYKTADGLADDYVQAIAIDGDGNKWFGTSSGVSRFDDIGISGGITDTEDAGMNGVTVNLTGAETRTATTTADGNYQFSDLTPGNYIITPVKSGYTFLPVSISTGSLAGDLVEQNFTGDRPPNVPAVVTPLDGAVDVSTGTALTWTGGDPDTGDTVTYDVYFSSFSPPSFKINQSGATYNPGGLDNNTTYYWKIVAKDSYDVETAGPAWSFVTGDIPFPVYYIKGYIKDSGEEGVSGVTVELTGAAEGSAATDSSGYYEFTNLASGNYAVTPSSAGCLFAPPNWIYSPLASNQGGQDFHIAGILTGEGNVEVRGGPKGYIKLSKGEKAEIIMRPVTSGLVTIKIYTLRKKLVWKKEIYVTGGTQPLPVVWECKNTGSEQVASGTYIAHIKGAGYNEKKYIVVVR